MQVPDMDEMISKTKEKLREGEVMAFAIGAGRFIPPIFASRKLRRGIKKALESVKEMEGFLGVHPIDIHHTLLIYDTLNNAKGAKNVLTSKGIKLGNIAPIIIPEEYGKKV